MKPKETVCAKCGETASGPGAEEVIERHVKEKYGTKRTR